MHRLRLQSLFLLARPPASVMTKRTRSTQSSPMAAANKKMRQQGSNMYNKIATAENAAAADHKTPLSMLEEEIKKAVKEPKKGASVVYWMRMQDLRVSDNRTLAAASLQATKISVPLIVLFVISPQDYAAHDRGPRRIDFMLRNLAEIKKRLAELEIPLHVVSHAPRRTLPSKILALLQSWDANHIFANIEYEVDELRRDISVCKLAQENGIQCVLIHDKLIVPPGTLETKQGKPYTVYSPWLRGWLPKLNENMHWLDKASDPKPNDKEIRKSKFADLLTGQIPDSVPGFECEDRDNMTEYWPAGTDSALKVLERFLHTKARKEQMGDVSPLSGGAEKASKDNRLARYSEDRSRTDIDSSSRLSPYLASGVISARECIRHVLQIQGKKKLVAERDDGAGMWVQELAWRDFYAHVLAAFPRVSMGRPFQEKFADVKWENNEKHLQLWKDGKTGVPIVDAAMRQIKTMGWTHNRCRMIVAMYLTKDLMLDWRLGEKYFMENLIDGDLASNNGGWQWSASTGTDPQPYFRIFNPINQSHKADPDGDYIRKYVPELAKLKGKEIHEPSKDSAQAHGYPLPLVNHKEARDRALRRYKSPGEE